jgi:hypothetical protein
VAAGDIIRVMQRGNWLQKIRVDNVFHLQDQTGEFTLAELLEYWEFEVLPRWRDNVSNAYGITSLSAQAIGPGDVDYAFRPIVAQGNLAQDNKAPVVCAGVVTWRTARGGRSGRGRTFFAGIPYDSDDKLYWGASGQIALADIRNNFLELFGPEGASTWRLGVYSRKIGGSLPPVNANGFRPVRSAQTQAYICTMGSRRAKWGI